MSEHRDVPISKFPEYQFSASTLPAGTAAHVIMFWVLTGMALAVFAPCVLVPIWQEVEVVRAYRQEMASAVQGLAAQVKKNQERIDGLREDPLVNERIARRELNYRPEAEQIVRVTSQELTTFRLHSPEPLWTDPQADSTSISQHWTQVLTRWLPDWPYQQVFGNETNRMLLMFMAAGLLIAAFVLFGRRPVRRTVGP